LTTIGNHAFYQYIRNEALSAGVYLVQFGNRPAEKVMVHPNM
jgi:hypothetical protein